MARALIVPLESTVLSDVKSTYYRYHEIVHDVRIYEIVVSLFLFFFFLPPFFLLFFLLFGAKYGLEH